MNQLKGLSVAAIHIIWNDASACLDHDEALQLLQGMILAYKKTTIIIDALDECDEKARSVVIKALRSLVSTSATIKMAEAVKAMHRAGRRVQSLFDLDLKTRPEVPYVAFVVNSGEFTCCVIHYWLSHHALQTPSRSSRLWSE